MAGGSPWNDELTQCVISCVLHVHNVLGPGFVERIYRRALVIELKQNNFSVEVEKSIPIQYQGRIIGCHRLDLVVEQNLIVELKTVAAINKVHYAQVKSYLRASGLARALLINFDGERADIRRIEYRK